MIIVFFSIKYYPIFFIEKLIIIIVGLFLQKYQAILSEETHQKELA
jgi:hypothetical protein